MVIDNDNVVEQLMKKNERAIEFIVDQYGGLIKSIVFRHMYGLEAFQDECINDILLAVWNNIRQFDPKKNSLKNWIGAVSKYKSIDYKRKYYKELLKQTIDDTMPDSTVIEDGLIQKELNDEMESMLKFLNPADKKLFFDHYVMETDLDILAEEYGMNISVLYNRLSRGRKKIRNCVERSRGENHAR